MTTPFTSRRIVFQGLGALGVAAVLAGCGSDDDGGDAGDTGESSAARDSTSPDLESTEKGRSTGAPVDALADVTEVPVGGGLILTDEKIVITQPTEGDFKAFGAKCKHAGFTVTSVEDNTIKCNHHGSEYDAETGEATNPPAPAGLDPVAIKVLEGKILKA